MKAILFVDDHEVLARLSCEILEMQGYKAVSAYSAADALAKFDQQDIDIVVTDFRMEGMNGLELAEKIREKSPATPVIIVTGCGLIDPGENVETVLQKDNLFPEPIEKILFFVGEGSHLPVQSSAVPN